MMIDMHVHLSDKRIYPEYWLQGIKKDLIQKIRVENDIVISDAFIDSYFEQVLSDRDAAKLIAQMDKNGVDEAVVLLLDLGYDRGDIANSIEEIYEIYHQVLKKHRDRLKVFAGIDPRRGKEGVDLFEKGIKEYGFCGLKLYPPCGFEIDDTRLHPYYEICNAHSIPILIHIGPSLPEMKTEFRYPQSILAVTEEFKRIPFILGHAALCFYDSSWDLPLKSERIFLEVSGFQKQMHQYDLLAKRMKHLFEVCPNHIVFGSDWPIFSDLKQSVEFFSQMKSLTDRHKELLFHKNAEGIFSMG